MGVIFLLCKMVGRGLLVFLLVALLARDSFQRGTLFLNEIQAVRDPITGEETLPIECTLWEDNMVWLDNFDSLFSPGIGAGSGVDVDGVLLDLGTWVFPNDFNVAGTVTINGLLQVNGGFLTDDGDFGDADGDDLDYSFEVENDTGNAWISGSLNIRRELNNKKPITNPGGTFVVAADGETTISGLLRPNGGVNIDNGQVTVGSDGSTFAVGSLNVKKDLILGTDVSEISELIPYTNGPGSVPNIGGSTTLKGQDAVDNGGSIVLTPGAGIGASPTQQTGDIVLGLENVAHDLSISRVAAQAGNAGRTVFGGGGSLANGRGGNVIFSPGQSSIYNGVLGNDGFLYLGDPADGANIPFFMVRPDVETAGTAGHTFITGQNSTAGTAGNTIIQAGDGNIAGGNIYLEPGTNENRQGNLFFGSPVAGGTTLRVSRPLDTDDIEAGPTWFIGQDASGGDGGDLYFEAGRGEAVRNGHIYLSPGSQTNGVTPSSGTIYWGTNSGHPELRIVRPITADNPAHDTSFWGQNTGAGAGGDLVLVAGDGLSGGDIHFEAGFGEEDYGGEIIVRGGDGIVGQGGNVDITAGVSGAGTTGNIFITAGDGSFEANPGSVFIAAIGEDVTVTATELFLDSIPFFFDNNDAFGDMVLENRVTGVTLTLTPNTPGMFILDQGIAGINNLLTDRIELDPFSFYRPETNPYDDTVRAAIEFQTALAEVRDALVAHELIVLQ